MIGFFRRTRKDVVSFRLARLRTYNIGRPSDPLDEMPGKPPEDPEYEIIAGDMAYYHTGRREPCLFFPDKQHLSLADLEEIVNQMKALAAEQEPRIP